MGGALAAFPTAAGHFFARDKVTFGGDIHFAGVGLTALAATAAAVVLTLIGARRRDGRTVLLGTAFSTMTALFAVHALATPGMVLAERSAGFVIATPVGLLIAGLFAAASALDLGPRTVALMRHRDVNAHFAGDSVRIFPTANVGMAVATDRGLVVPVIRGAERLTLAEIAAARADLVSRARDAKLTQQDLEGGTFTVSNLGMYGVEQFVAVLNPPEVAILAVGAIEERPVVAGEELEFRPMMSLTLTCDHRAIDGSVAAEFLGTVRALLEEPGLAL